jgi:hypothetical protein
MLRKFKIPTLLSILAGALILGSAAIASGVLSANAIQSKPASQQCKYADDKISDKADVSESGEACNIKVSGDSPTMQLLEILCPC